MDKDVVYSKIRKILVDVMSVDPDLINPSAGLRDVGLDSLEAVDFIIALEDEFNVNEITDEEAQATRNISDYVELIMRKIN